MEPIVFVKTDPTFMIVDKMVEELISIKCLNVVGYKELKCEKFIHGNDIHDEFRFGSWYDFARTAQAVLRLYVLEATEMRELFDPKFSIESKIRNEGSMTVLKKHGKNIQMGNGNERRAQQYASEFDRLYPHLVTEYKLRDIEVGKTISLPGSMYVVDFNQNLLYHIVTNMDVKYACEYANADGMVIQATPHVTALKCSITEIPEDDAGQAQHYNILQKFIAEYEKLPEENILQKLIADYENLPEEDLGKIIADLELNDAREDIDHVVAKE